MLLRHPAAPALALSAAPAAPTASGTALQALPSSAALQASGQQLSRWRQAPHAALARAQSSRSRPSSRLAWYRRCASASAASVVLTMFEHATSIHTRRLLALDVAVLFLLLNAFLHFFFSAFSSFPLLKQAPRTDPLAFTARVCFFSSCTFRGGMEPGSRTSR